MGPARPCPACPAGWPGPVPAARARFCRPLPSVKVTVRGGGAGRGRRCRSGAGGTRAPARPRGSGGTAGPSPGHRRGSARQRHLRVPPSCAAPTRVRAWAAGAALPRLRAEHRCPVFGRSPSCGAGGTASLAGPSAGTVTRTEPARFSRARSGAAATIPGPRSSFRISRPADPSALLALPRSPSAGPRPRGDLGPCPGWGWGRGAAAGVARAGGRWDEWPWRGALPVGTGPAHSCGAGRGESREEGGWRSGACRNGAPSRQAPHWGFGMHAAASETSAGTAATVGDRDSWAPSSALGG